MPRKAERRGGPRPGAGRPTTVEPLDGINAQMWAAVVYEAPTQANIRTAKRWLTGESEAGCVALDRLFAARPEIDPRAFVAGLAARCVGRSLGSQSLGSKGV